MKSKRTGADIILNMQYVKDLSFENPKAPIVYTYKNVQPKIDASIDINATKVQNEVYEIEMVINLDAKHESNTLFVVELVYAGIFNVRDVSEELLPENLFIDCPTMLFPFARRIIADIIRDANFPPFMLDIIDFEQMYNSKKDTLKRNMEEKDSSQSDK